MPIDTTVWAADLAGIIADLPVDAKFGSTEFDCSATELSQEETLILVGDVKRNGVRISFPISAFTPDATWKPQARLQLKFPDASTFTNYEIVSLNKDSALVAWEVVLKADNRS